MARDFKTETYGDLEAWLHCPGCHWEGIVYYSGQTPSYCSNSCKQKVYRLRRKCNALGVTHLFVEWEEMGLKDYIPALRSILERFGPEAARDAGQLATAVAKQVRKIERRL